MRNMDIIIPKFPFFMHLPTVRRYPPKNFGRWARPVMDL